METDTVFAASRLRFIGPDGDGLAIIESTTYARAPWLSEGIPGDAAIRGFAGARFSPHDTVATEALLGFMGYQRAEKEGDVTRFIIPNGNGADTIDVAALPKTPFARPGAGSVHHIAFAVDNREKQLEVR